MIHKLASLKITVICLLWLFVLTFWGTLAQVQDGLYAARERFFHAFVLWVFGAVPLPAGQLTLWVLFVNLLAATWTCFIRIRGWRYAGLVIVHLGLLFYLVAAFVVFHGAEEAHLQLAEHQQGQVAVSPVHWDVTLTSAEDRAADRIDLDRLLKSGRWQSPRVGLTATVEAYAPHTAQSGPGVTDLVARPPSTERSENIPGLRLRLARAGQAQVVTVTGWDPAGRDVWLGAASSWRVGLRRRPLRLPFAVRLEDFRVSFYPNTTQARSYESDVTVLDGGLQRQARISMNRPLRVGAYTLFQASYQIDPDGRESSVFAVVKNIGRPLPTWSSLLVSLGLAWHVVALAWQRRKEAGHAC